MRVELARLHRRLNATLVYVTHDQAEALTLGEKIVVLDKGTIQQIGSASDIYRKPANTLVASFVGSPQMNLLEGRLDASGASFQRDSLRLDLSALLKRSLAQLSGSPVILGIRAEDLQPVEPRQGWLQGEVELVEDLGSDRFIHLKCGTVELIARAGREFRVRPGETIGVNPAPGQLHVFHDGRRIDLR
jgi:sn-glycerol 3-phosphate transport system ATP-binding protein